MPYSLRDLAPVVVLSALLSSPQILIAQSQTDNETTVTYPAEYFTEYAPVSARDMLDRIPGVGNTTGGGPATFGGFSGGGGGGGGRGFGSGGGSSEILINGKRTAGKNNATGAVLERITAQQVAYIQLIRGTSGDLDVRGSGQVINVVLNEELDTSSISWELNTDYYRDGHTQPGANVSYSNQIGALDFVLSAVAEPRYDHEESREVSVLGDFSPNDFITEDRILEQTTYDFAANLDYQISENSSARFNALYSQNDNPTSVFRTITDYRTVPNGLTLEREAIPGERDNWEVGGDYETFFDSGARFKVLFVLNQADADSVRERFRRVTPETEEKNLFLRSGSVTEEEIVRGSYTFDLRDNQDVELGAERALTTLDSNLALGVLSASGTPSPAFGGLVPVPVSNANSTVQETRYEPFIIHNWTINPRMSLESHLLYEYSEIEQWGDVSRKRDFDFIKPKVDLRYDLTPSMQVRGSIEKVVNQLRFSDFVAATDSEDEDSNTVAGNANLRQEWFWAYNFNAEYRLPDDIGVVDANIFYHDHHDVIERIDVSPSEDNLQSANGNIGDGRIYGITLNSSLRMKMINLPNLLVSTRLNVADSEIVDPFLGIERRFSQHGRGRLSVSFRHDLPRWRLNWGGSWNNRFDHNQFTYDIDDYFTTLGQPSVTAFAEHITRGGVSYRFDVRDVTSNEQCRERRRFVGRIEAGILEEIEDRCATRGTVLSLKISSSF